MPEQTRRDARTRIAVIGAGVMGSGIAQALATSGASVVCVDRSPDQLAAASGSIRWGRYGFERAVERKKISRDAADYALALIDFTDDLHSALRGANLVIEAIPEILELKLDLFQQLGHDADDQTVLASNTSGLPVAALAAAARRPEHVLAWHWASPAQIRPFAEIVRTPRTSQQSVDVVVDLALRCAKRPIVITENPKAWGFVANRIYIAAYREAQRVRDEGLATEVEIDNLLSDAYAWPTGPFATIKGATSGWGTIAQDPSAT